MLGVALFFGGCGEKEVADEKPAKEQKSVKAPVREISFDELERRDEIQYVKGENKPFTGTAIRYYPDGWRTIIPYVNGIKHGTMIWYSRDGSKSFEMPYVDGKIHGTEFRYHKNGNKKEEKPFLEGIRHGTAIEYNEDGSKSAEYVFENGKEISREKF